MGAGTVQVQGSSKRRRTKRVRPMSEINVTPFVDVMLVLLIIFMVTAPMLTVGIPIELPKTAANALPGENDVPLSITISADKKIVLQETEVSYEQLIPKLSAISKERESDLIYLRADGSVPYELVAKIMGAINGAGFSNVGLVTDVRSTDIMNVEN
jgi:biopolymer transport protein TolR